ncbi:hypothetical protein [Pontivivens ytuae]|uniref:Uncharacterized protein n=1 Tax=Pontivivens ytuae TaxID=2789856 RepID=A0A7S9LU44_9RHOB|nr:hypothetical protein [Pontivivens ytuae]QPH55198.1 hypothetical protein I0K15_05515 [Pontivivens ytuae]
MEFIVRVSLGRGGHQDLLLTIPQLDVEVLADTYYFALAIEKRGVALNERAVRKGVVALLNYWIAKVSSCEDGEVIYLPFDFSDQYTGCFQVTGMGSNLRLSYGFSLLEGYRVNPLDPGDYYKKVRDFKTTSDRYIDLSHEEFLGALRVAVAKIEAEDSIIQ